MAKPVSRNDLNAIPDHPLLNAAVEYLNGKVLEHLTAHPESKSEIHVKFEDVSWAIGLNGKALPDDLVTQTLAVYETSDLVSCKRGSSGYGSSSPRFEFSPR